MESPLAPSFVLTLLLVAVVIGQRLPELLERFRQLTPVSVLGQLNLATATESWPIVSDMPPRQRRRRTRQPQQPVVSIERTRPVTAQTDAAVFEAPPQLPPGPVSPPNGQREVLIGDVVNSAEQPVLELEPQDQLNVVVNVSYARNESGTRAVRVLDRRGQVLLQLTAAQAHQLALDLTQSADVVGTIRVQAGFDS